MLDMNVEQDYVMQSQSLADHSSIDEGATEKHTVLVNRIVNQLRVHVSPIAVWKTCSKSD